MYRAVNFKTRGVAACKVVKLTKDTTPLARQMLKKEMQVHAYLKHRNVLEFYAASMVKETDEQYIPGVYMLLELAAGGDLFDKIGAPWTKK